MSSSTVSPTKIIDEFLQRVDECIDLGTNSLLQSAVLGITNYDALSQARSHSSREHKRSTRKRQQAIRERDMRMQDFLSSPLADAAVSSDLARETEAPNMSPIEPANDDLDIFSPQWRSPFMISQRLGESALPAMCTRNASRVSETAAPTISASIRLQSLQDQIDLYISQLYRTLSFDELADLMRQRIILVLSRLETLREQLETLDNEHE